MRLLLAGISAVAALSVAPAGAQPYPRYPAQVSPARDVGRELDEVYRRIEGARQTGQISESEAQALHREGQRLFDLFRYMRRDGLDPIEYREIDDGARALLDRLDRRLRYGDWRDQRDDGYRRGDGVGEERGVWRKGGEDDWQRDDDWQEERDQGWSRDDPWAEPLDRGSEPGKSADDRWNQPTAPSDDNWANPDENGGWADSDPDDQPADTPSNAPPPDDWWLPPDERERIAPRPGDYPQ